MNLKDLVHIQKELDLLNGLIFSNVSSIFSSLSISFLLIGKLDRFAYCLLIIFNEFDDKPKYMNMFYF